jgi:small subunit ribosomal protein S21|tara:strand:- start:131 stop:364 length:234 start_codon:yes stop_codon:yes gene_type:complete
MPSVRPKYKQESFDKMLRRFKNQCERAGIVKRVRELEYYEKPNVKRNQKNQALKRTKLNNIRKAEAADQRRRQQRIR